MENNATTNNLRRLSDADFEVAKDEPDVRGWTVVDRSGEECGEVDDLIVDTEAMKVRYLQVDPEDADGADDDRELYIPIDSVDLDRDDKRVVLRGSAASMRELVPADLEGRLSSSHEAQHVVRRTETDRDSGHADRMTRTEEEVRIGKRAVQTGEVVVGKHVETGRVHDEVKVARDEVRVERRPVEGRVAGDISASDREIRVPITEEEVVVEKRPVVKEELVISKERVEETRPVDVEVRKEEFDIKGGERTKRGER